MRSLPQIGDASMFNIWYSKWYSEGRQKYNSAPMNSSQIARCVPLRDSGLTRANLKASRDPFFCVFFARGCCGKGWQCRYLHRVPTQDDEQHIGRAHDCFGRLRHAVDKADMSGVGSFERESRTLAVNHLGVYETERVEAILRRHFEPFGAIMKVQYAEKRRTATIKFACRLNAEFAKEAMNEQALDKKEVITVRWAPDGSTDAEDLKMD